MVLDDKYMETVGEEEKSETDFDYGAVLEEFVTNAVFMEDAKGITFPGDCQDRKLKQLSVDEIFADKSYFGNIETIEWEDKQTGEKLVNYKIKLPNCN